MIVLGAFAARGAQIEITPATPGGVYPDSRNQPPYLSATVQSEFEIAAVTATFLTQTFNLSYNAPNDRWVQDNTTVNISGAPSGTNVIVFRATDVFGNSAEASLPIKIDFPPSLVVEAPSDFALARPLVHAAARSMDDLDVPLMEILDPRVMRYVHAVTNRIDLMVDVSAFEESVVLLRFFSTDNGSAARYTVEGRNVLSLSNPRYQPEVLVDGIIRDANSNAVLYVKRDRALTLLDRRTGRETMLATNFDTSDVERVALLTATGALFHDRSGADARLIDYNGGEFLDQGAGFQTAVVKGRFGVMQRPLRSGQLSVLRDFAARTNTDLPIEAGNSVDVAENGAVAFASAPDSTSFANGVYLFADNQLTLLSSSTNQIHDWVRTDGTNTVWMTNPDPFATPTKWLIEAFTAAGIVELNTNFVGSQNAAVAGGWIAFPKIGTTGHQQIWLRSPDGLVRQGSFYSEDAILRDLRADGAMVLGVGSRFNPGRIAFAIPNKTPGDLSADFGARYFFEGERLSAVFGGAYFSVMPEGELIGLSSPRLEAGGGLSVYVTSTSPASFVLEGSNDLFSWSSISTNTVTDTLPMKVQVAAGPEFVRLRKF